jgi:glucan phosphoethanolaminetransferase (alkaline phosphatase superfamily)
MSLKLFRSTGYSSILAPGESRVATHPGWLAVVVSLWIGFGCSLSLWRSLRAVGGGISGLAHALLAGAFIFSACFALLSLFGWRRTLKHTATLLLLVGALAAASLWVQGRPLDGDLFEQGIRGVLLPSWPSLLRWQFAAVLLGVGLVPMLCVWQLPLRRLSGQQQLASNVTGVLIGLVAMAATGWPLLR